MMKSAFAQELDDQLIARAQRGDRRAFKVIYESFSAPAYSLALRMTQSETLAEEILQDGMLLVFRRIDQFRFESPFWGWVRRLFINTTISALRKKSRDNKVICFQEQLHELAADNGNEALGDIERALKKLPQKRRSVVWLYAVEGFTHPEIAELLGVTVSDSKVQLFRAREQLKQWWHAETIDGGDAAAVPEV